jgi:hypothetical protein
VSLPLLFCLLVTLRRAASSSIFLPLCNALAQAQKQKDHLTIDWNSQNLIQNEPFLFISWLTLGIFYSNRKLTNICTQLLMLLLLRQEKFSP